MADRTNFRYSESHEWFSLKDDIVTIGLTQYAVNELTDVTYIEMKEIGQKISSGESVGEVESVKTTSEIFSFVSGEIVEINQNASENPSLLNTDPYGEGWLIRIKTEDASPLNEMLGTSEYEKQYPT